MSQSHVQRVSSFSKDREKGTRNSECFAAAALMGDTT